MIIRYTRYESSRLATIVSVFGNLMYALAVIYVATYIGDMEGMREEMTLVELLIFTACLGACGFGLNRLAERIAMNKEKKGQEREDEMVRKGVCPNCGSDMMGMDVCARCGYVASLGERPTEWEEEGQGSPADGSAQEQMPAWDIAAPDQMGDGGVQQGSLSMKWYKFIIYVQLFLVAFIELGTAGRYFTGLDYGENAELVYQVYGSLKMLDMSMGILSLALAVLCIYVRGRMRRFRKNAVPLYLSIFIISLVSVIVYNIAAVGIVGGIDEGSMVTLARTIGIQIAYIICNAIYFKKRSHLFND